MTLGKALASGKEFARKGVMDPGNYIHDVVQQGIGQPLLFISHDGKILCEVERSDLLATDWYLKQEPLKETVTVNVTAFNSVGANSYGQITVNLDSKFVGKMVKVTIEEIIDET